jgi:hypothetical protein
MVLLVNRGHQRVVITRFKHESESQSFVRYKNITLIVRYLKVCFEVIRQDKDQNLPTRQSKKTS